MAKKNSYKETKLIFQQRMDKWEQGQIVTLIHSIEEHSDCGLRRRPGIVQAGIEGNLHAVREVWPESGGWTFDAGTEESPTNQQYTARGENGENLPLAEGVTWSGPDPLFPEDTDPCLPEATPNSAYKADSGFGACLVDADNAFQRINRYLMLWSVFHRWNVGSRFAFNRYRHHNLIFVQDVPGTECHTIYSQEGVAQGCVLGMYLYGIGLMPLCELMRASITLNTSLSYADDIASVGEAEHNAACLDLLVRMGPKYGYHPSPEKSHYICKGEDEKVVRAAFEAKDLTVQYGRGHTYLGGFIGSGERKKEWMEDKIVTWVAAVNTLAKVAVNYPQSAYAGFAFCLQCEWQYASRISPNIAGYFEPLEEAIRTNFLPALFDLGKTDIDPSLRETLANSVKKAGIGVRNPIESAGMNFRTSSQATGVLVASIVKREPLHLRDHRLQVSGSNHGAGRNRLSREQSHLDELGRGKPALARRLKRACMAGAFLSVIPHRHCGNILSKEEFRDNLRLRENLLPLNMPHTCDGCGERLTVEHALQCKKGGLVSIRHEDVAGEWRNLCGLAFTPSAVQREPCIHSSVGRRERAITAAAQQRSPSTQQPPMVPNPYNVQTQPQQLQQQANGNAPQQPPQSEPIDGKRGDAAVYGFWAHQRDCVFDVRITDTDARSYRNTDPATVLARQEKEKKDKYLHACHEKRKDFTPLVYSVDGIRGRKAKSAERRLASALGEKWSRPYSYMVHYVKVRMSIAVVRANSLLIRGSRDRGPARSQIDSGPATLLVQEGRIE